MTTENHYQETTAHHTTTQQPHLTHPQPKPLRSTPTPKQKELVWKILYTNIVALKEREVAL